MLAPGIVTRGNFVLYFPTCYKVTTSYLLPLFPFGSYSQQDKSLRVKEPSKFEEKKNNLGTNIKTPSQSQLIY